MRDQHQSFGLILRAAVLIAFAAYAQAAPALTPIQDTVTNADGSRFTGTIRVSWDSFTATDGSNVPAGARLVTVISGLLRLSLTPYNGYTADYQSMRGVTSREYWGVENSGTPKRLSDLRSAALSSPLAVPTFSIGTVTALASGSAPTVTITGTNLNPVLNFGFPTAAVAPSWPTWDSLTSPWDSYTAAWDSYH